MTLSLHSEVYFSRLRMDVRLAQRNPKILSRLIRQKRQWQQMDPSNELTVEALQVLQAIPSSATCSCCGFSGLTNVRMKDDKIVGPECLFHEFGSCRGKGGARA